MSPLLRRTLPLLIAVAALLVIFGVAAPNFLSVSNFLNLGEQISVNAILAFALTLTILIGGIDLSVGALLALVGAATIYAVRPDGWGLPTPVAFGAGFAIALAFGTFHGVAASKTLMPPFIITLGTMLIARGLAFRFNEGRPMSIPRSEEFLMVIGNGHVVSSLTISTAIMLGIYALCGAMLHFTVFGRHLYAIGDSRQAALYSGIRVTRCEIIVYSLASLLTAVAGIIHASENGSLEPASGEGFELNAIAAAVVGGASLKGGRGTMTGTLIGAIIIGILDKGLNQAGVHFSYQRIIKGAVILSAVWLDVRRRK